MKKTLRKTYKDKRSQLSAEEIKNYSSAIAELFFSHFSPSEITHIFIPIQKFNEVDTRLIIDGLQHNDLITCTSVSDFDTGRMKCISFTAETEFLVSKYGIPEPIGGPTINPNQIDRIIVPLLAFDEAGNRLGYGAGFYDRFFEECDPEIEKIGVSFFPPEEEIPTEAHDVKLNHCVTPTKVFSF